ncbi:MAG: hypothetical protein O8C64_05770 [Candidatus Methanoperedens sp.]|nr:hypothetical protein [Candidatus Methanoperedens sp.]MCZ7405347.1 hypothetical protein [Candidatus Methanoperedens sp.]
MSYVLITNTDFLYSIFMVHVIQYTPTTIYYVEGFIFEGKKFGV